MPTFNINIKKQKTTISELQCACTDFCLGQFQISFIDISSDAKSNASTVAYNCKDRPFFNNDCNLSIFSTLTRTNTPFLFLPFSLHRPPFLSPFSLFLILIVRLSFYYRITITLFKYILSVGFLRKYDNYPNGDIQCN